ALCLGSNPSRPARFKPHPRSLTSCDDAVTTTEAAGQAASASMSDNQRKPAWGFLMKTEVATEVFVPETVTDGRGKPMPERKRHQKLAEDRRFKIFSGTANRQLAEEICKHIGVPLGETKTQRFADGEIYFQLLENVPGVDVFIVQPTCNPVDQHLVELLIMIDALKRASAGRITTVVPYYGYARQDRKDRPRVAISSKLVADLLTTAGANRAL